MKSRIWFLIAAALWISTSMARADTNCQYIGSQLYCSDSDGGTSHSRRIGNSTYGTDSYGNTWNSRRIGDSTYGSDSDGNSWNTRNELETLLAFLRESDSLVVTRIDRLARSLMDLQQIAQLLKEKGVSLIATEQHVDTSTSAGKCFFDMLGVFAEFETNLRKERQMEGIAKAKAAGKYRGRKKTISEKKVLELHAAGLGGTKIAEKLGISRASVYRYLQNKF